MSKRALRFALKLDQLPQHISILWLSLTLPSLPAHTAWISPHSVTYQIFHCKIYPVQTFLLPAIFELATYPILPPLLCLLNSERGSAQAQAHLTSSCLKTYWYWCISQPSSSFKSLAIIQAEGVVSRELNLTLPRLPSSLLQNLIREVGKEIDKYCTRGVVLARDLTSALQPGQASKTGA